MGSLKTGTVTHSFTTISISALMTISIYYLHHWTFCNFRTVVIYTSLKK